MSMRRALASTLNNFRLGNTLGIKSTEPILQPCPECRAPAGTLCLYPGGERWFRYHTSRVIAAAWHKYYSGPLEARPGRSPERETNTRRNEMVIGTAKTGDQAPSHHRRRPSKPGS